MILDFQRSLVTIAGRRLPAIGLLCPSVEGDDSEPADHMLGGPGGPGELNLPRTDQVYIPLENGVIVALEREQDGPELYSVSLWSRTCELTRQTNVEGHDLFIPISVHIVDGVLTATPAKDRRLRGLFQWSKAEPDWTVEFIDRLARMPFTPPDGPQVTPISLAATYELFPPPE